MSLISFSFLNYEMKSSNVLPQTKILRRNILNFSSNLKKLFYTSSDWKKSHFSLKRNNSEEIILILI